MTVVGERGGEERWGMNASSVSTYNHPQRCPLLRRCSGRKLPCFSRAADSAFLTPSRLVLGANQVLLRLESLDSQTVADRHGQQTCAPRAIIDGLFFRMGLRLNVRGIPQSV